MGWSAVKIACVPMSCIRRGEPSGVSPNQVFHGTTTLRKPYLKHLIPAQKQPRTHIGIGTANGGTSVGQMLNPADVANRWVSLFCLVADLEIPAVRVTEVEALELNDC